MSDMHNIYIAGASSRARTTKEYIEYLNPDRKVGAFLVSPEMTEKEDIVDGIHVLPRSKRMREMMLPTKYNTTYYRKMSCKYEVDSGA